VATSESEAGGQPELERISERLEALAQELDEDIDDERTGQLIREASKLAAEAGQELERMLNRASGPQP
jgi:hypothetical protein